MTLKFSPTGISEILRSFLQIKFENETLFEGVNELERNYGVSRSFRRGANTRAKEEGVSEELRKFINS